MPIDPAMQVSADSVAGIGTLAIIVVIALIVGIAIGSLAGHG